MRLSLLRGWTLNRHQKRSWVWIGGKAGDGYVRLTDVEGRERDVEVNTYGAEAPLFGDGGEGVELYVFSDVCGGCEDLGALRLH